MNIDAVVFPLSVNGTPDDNKRVDVDIEGSVSPLPPHPRGQRTRWIDCICANEKRMATIPSRKGKKTGFSLPPGLITFYVPLILSAPPFVFSSTFLQFFDPRFSVQRKKLVHRLIDTSFARFGNNWNNWISFVRSRAKQWWRTW